MKKLLKTILNLILISILIFSGYKIYLKLSEYKKADNVYNELREQSSSANNKHNELTSLNEDYRFWINIENTNIDYPVVQGEDNDYYLTHDFNKNYLASGSIFMDYRNSFEDDKSVIVYGHHMRNKTMFGELANFKDESFFKNNNLIEVEYKNKTYTYEVFSVYVADLSSDDYLKVEFNDDSDFEDYINYITNRSMYDSDVNVSSDDKIITLYTCSYEFDNARTIVHGKLVSVN